MNETKKHKNYLRGHRLIRDNNTKSMTYSGVRYLLRGKMRSSLSPYYYYIYLWSNQEDYEEAATNGEKDTVALCQTDSYRGIDAHDVIVRPKLGEIHFVSGSWDINTVAHECQHAILHRMRYLEPQPAHVLDEFADDHDPEDEEDIAYEAGAWVESCLAWLTNNDPRAPYPKHLFDLKTN